MLHYMTTIKKLNSERQYIKSKERSMIRNENTDLSQLNRITNIVCDVFGVPLNLIKHKSRVPSLVIPRQVIGYFARAYYPYHQIGFYFDQHHSTIISGVNSVNDLLSYDKEFMKKFDAVEFRVNNKIEQIEEKAESLTELNTFH